jgi:hypothetical protein
VLQAQKNRKAFSIPGMATFFFRRSAADSEIFSAAGMLALRCRAKKHKRRSAAAVAAKPMRCSSTGLRCSGRELRCRIQFKKAEKSILIFFFKN